MNKDVEQQDSNEIDRLTSRRRVLLGGGALAGVGALSLVMSEAANADTQESGRPSSTHGISVNVQDFGASGSDFQTQGSISAGSSQLTVRSAGDFAAGQGVYVAGAGSGGGPLVTQIQTVAPAGVLILDKAASTSVSGAQVQHDDTDAIRKAFASLGKPPQGRLAFPGGLYRISSTIEFDLASSQTVVNYEHNNPNTGAFELDMVGRIYAAPGIGKALYIHSGYNSIIRAKFYEGGKYGDFGLELFDLVGAQVEVFAQDFAGTVLHVNGGGIVANTRVSISTIHKLFTLNCGRALLFEQTSGFGLIDDVWDGASAHGSVIRDSNDVSISHWENLFHQSVNPPGSEIYSLQLVNCAAVHIGTIALGDLANSLMLIRGCFGFSIDKFYSVSAVAYPGGADLNGLEIVDSTGTIANLFSLNCGNGVTVRGSNVILGNHEARGNNRNLRIGPSSDSKEARVNVNARYGDGGPLQPGAGSNYEDVLVESGLTGGYLQLGGGTRDTNQSNSSGVCAVDCRSSAFPIYTWAFVQERSNVAAGICHPDTSKVVLAGGDIANGVVKK